MNFQEKNVLLELLIINVGSRMSWIQILNGGTWLKLKKSFCFFVFLIDANFQRWKRRKAVRLLHFLGTCFEFVILCFSLRVDLSWKTAFCDPHSSLYFICTCHGGRKFKIFFHLKLFGYYLKHLEILNCCWIFKMVLQKWHTQNKLN